ncbi:MAG: RND transporter, partial [Pseudomonadota bacterium]
PDESFIRYGAAARGWVLLDEVSVGYELWRQLNNFPPQFPAGTGPNVGAGTSS